MHYADKRGERDPLEPAVAETFKKKRTMVHAPSNTAKRGRSALNSGCFALPWATTLLSQTPQEHSKNIVEKYIILLWVVKRQAEWVVSPSTKDLVKEGDAGRDILTCPRESHYNNDHNDVVRQ